MKRRPRVTGNDLEVVFHTARQATEVPGPVLVEAGALRLLVDAATLGLQLRAARRAPRRGRMPLLQSWLASAVALWPGATARGLWHALPEPTDIADRLYRDDEQVVEIDAHGREHVVGFHAFRSRLSQARATIATRASGGVPECPHEHETQTPIAP